MISHGRNTNPVAPDGSEMLHCRDHGDIPANDWEHVRQIGTRNYTVSVFVLEYIEKKKVSD